MFLRVPRPTTQCKCHLREELPTLASGLRSLAGLVAACYRLCCRVAYVKTPHSIVPCPMMGSPFTTTFPASSVNPDSIAQPSASSLLGIQQRLCFSHWQSQVSCNRSLRMQQHFLINIVWHLSRELQSHIHGLLRPQRLEIRFWA